jgi:lipopolysaccharide transport system permease protein
MSQPPLSLHRAGFRVEVPVLGHAYLMTFETEDAGMPPIDLSADALPGAPEIVIRPSKGFVPLNLRELWNYRNLLYFLCWRDIKVRYKQTLLGASWAILQPVMNLVVFTIIFGNLAHIKTDGPYQVFCLTALVPWTFFAYAMTQSANSLVNSSFLVSKVYLPRLIIPIASALAGLVDFALAFMILIGMMIYYRITPTPALLLLPLFVLLALLAALAVGIGLSAVNVQYRDVRYLVPFLSQMWMYATPVVYPISLTHSKLHVLLSLNPMTGVVEGFRWALLGKQGLDTGALILSATVTVAGLTGSLFYFRRVEKQFADVV